MVSLWFGERRASSMFYVFYTKKWSTGRRIEPEEDATKLVKFFIENDVPFKLEVHGENGAKEMTMPEAVEFAKGH